MSLQSSFFELIWSELGIIQMMLKMLLSLSLSFKLSLSMFSFVLSFFLSFSLSWLRAIQMVPELTPLGAPSYC